MIEKVLSIDVAAFHYINNGLSNKWLDNIMPVVTQLGSIYFVLIFSLILALTKTRKHMAMIGIVFSANLLSFELLKHLVGRNRPFVSHDVVLRAEHLFTDSMELVTGITKSFPSAHTAIAFMLAVILSYYWKNYSILFYLAAVAVGFSRIYLGLHFPSDIVAGLILGTVIARFCLGNNYLNERIFGEKRTISNA